VWEQEARFFQAKGDFRSPSDIFIEDIVSLIRSWRQEGDEVILAIDSNQDVYEGKLARCLTEDRINLSCLMEAALGEKVPNSHFRGQGKITTIFGSPGLVEGHAMCYPHWYGIGDHRVFLLEISANSLFGGIYPAITRPASRLLNSKITRIKNRYCRKLCSLTADHKMEAKLQHLQVNRIDKDHQHHLKQSHDKWDKELGDLMRSAEKHCTKLR
jgi:hypothetical protein